jgi:hypothetical protein
VEAALVREALPSLSPFSSLYPPRRFDTLLKSSPTFPPAPIVGLGLHSEIESPLNMLIVSSVPYAVTSVGMR